MSQGNVDKKASELAEMVIQDFNLEKDNNLIHSGEVDELKEKLDKIVAYLLDNDFERLLNAMYRLDINEEKFKMAISGLHGSNISMEITDLIIARELQKMETRRKYGR